MKMTAWTVCASVCLGGFVAAAGENAEVGVAGIATEAELVDFLNNQHDISSVPHGPEGDFSLFGHLDSTRTLLREQHDASPELLRAGLFHSIYGTEGFQGKTLAFAERDALVKLIGPHAEKMAYANCVMNRTSFDAQVRARATAVQCATAAGGGGDEDNSPGTGPAADTNHSVSCAAASADVDAAGEVYYVDTRPELWAEGVEETLEMTAHELEDLMRVHLVDMIDNVERYKMWFYRRDEYQLIADTLGGTYSRGLSDVMQLQPASATPENSRLPEMVGARKHGMFDDVVKGRVSYDALFTLYDSKAGVDWEQVVGLVLFGVAFGFCVVGRQGVHQRVVDEVVSSTI